MSQFIRRESPPVFANYRDYRPFLRRDFHYVCAYCERTELALGGEEFFEIDHFRPFKKFPAQQTHYPNLYYACGKCNRYKGSVWPTEDRVTAGFRFADPCLEDMYSRHFDETQDGALRPRTTVGEYTCAHIRLNRSALVAWRQERRLVAADLTVLQAIVRDLELELKTASAPDFQNELKLRIGLLDATIARKRRQYSLT